MILRTIERVKAEELLRVRMSLHSFTDTAFGGSFPTHRTGDTADETGRSSFGYAS